MRSENESKGPTVHSLETVKNSQMDSEYGRHCRRRYGGGYRASDHRMDRKFLEDLIVGQNRVLRPSTVVSRISYFWRGSCTVQELIIHWIKMYLRGPKFKQPILHPQTVDMHQQISTHSCMVSTVLITRWDVPFKQELLPGRADHQMLLPMTFQRWRTYPFG